MHIWTLFSLSPGFHIEQCYRIHRYVEVPLVLYLFYSFGQKIWSIIPRPSDSFILVFEEMTSFLWPEALLAGSWMIGNIGSKMDTSCHCFLLPLCRYYSTMCFKAFPSSLPTKIDYPRILSSVGTFFWLFIRVTEREAQIWTCPTSWFLCRYCTMSVYS